MKKILVPKVILGLVTLSVVLLFGAIFVLFQNIKNESENASKLQNSIDLSTKQNQYVTSLQTSLQNSNGDIAKVNGSILRSDEDVTFIEQLENVAKNNGLNVVISSLSVEDIPNVTSSSLTSLKIRTSMQGSWIGMIVFLTRLESLPFVMRVEKFDLTNSSDNPIGLTMQASSTQNWQATIEIRVLQYK